MYNNKKQKLRIVFDCSSKYQGAYLNDHLLQGQDLMNSTRLLDQIPEEADSIDSRDREDVLTNLCQPRRSQLHSIAIMLSMLS